MQTFKAWETKGVHLAASVLTMFHYAKARTVVCLKNQRNKEMSKSCQALIKRKMTNSLRTTSLYLTLQC